MLIEIIRIEPNNGKIFHITAADVQVTKLGKLKDKAISDALAYVNDYLTKTGFKVVNAETVSGSIFYHIVKE